jgi:hypothetical protein
MCTHKTGYWVFQLTCTVVGGGLSLPLVLGYRYIQERPLQSSSFI